MYFFVFACVCVLFFFRKNKYDTLAEMVSLRLTERENRTETLINLREEMVILT